MRWLLYNLLFTLAYLLLAPHFLLRMRRRGGYRERFADRFGRYPDDIAQRLRSLDRPVWIHAVSVGEVHVAGQVMAAIRERAPSTRFVFSTTSSTGWREAQKRVTDDDTLIFYPLDFPPCVRRAFDAIRPAMLILTESEIWPNAIRTCHARGIPLYLVNARVSDKSAPGYRRLRLWFGPVLRMFTRIFAQSALDRDRLLAAGADPAAIEVTGSFKFDTAARAPLQEAAARDFLERCGIGDGHTVLLGASTWPGEDAILIRIYARLRERFPALRLVIVPRHFEKADAVQAEIERAGFACIRKSKTPTPNFELRTPNSIVLADTTGELMGFHGNAHIVFVGKSLCEHGAQNMIEPCLCGAATLVGPHTENFRPVMADLLDAQTLIQVRDADELEREIGRLLADPAARAALGARATAAVQRRTGVVARVIDALGVAGT
ncbi:MAG: 3-deoxy-D-manno-octulosonic acid transferase [Kiritimatiellaeota bacterium]|nr:3-deoxy-D-manno-octulosonic acid transferase [Kiritimatiellota bacterium]